MVPIKISISIISADLVQIGGLPFSSYYFCQFSILKVSDDMSNMLMHNPSKRSLFAKPFWSIVEKKTVVKYAQVVFSCNVSIFLWILMTFQSRSLLSDLFASYFCVWVTASKNIFLYCLLIFISFSFVSLFDLKCSSYFIYTHTVFNIL